MEAGEEPLLNNSKKKQSHYGFVLPVMFLTAANLSITFSAFPELNLAFCNNEAYKAIMYDGVSRSIGALLLFFVSPMIGSLSDHLGRKWFLFAACIWASIPMILLVSKVSLWYYFGARTLGMQEGLIYGIVFSYVADCSEPRHQVRNFTATGSMLGCAFMVAPIATVLNVEDAILLSTGLCVLNILYCLVVLPETIRPFKKEEDKGTMQDTLMEAASATVRPISSICTVLSSGTMILLCVAVGTTGLAREGFTSITVTMLISYFDFDAVEVVLFCFLFGFWQVCDVAIIVPFFCKHIGDKWTLLLSYMCLLVVGVVYALMPTVIHYGWIAYLCASLSSVTYASDSLAASIAFTTSPRTDVGTFQCALSGVQSLVSGLGPLCLSLVFYIKGPELAYIAGAILALGGLIVTLCIPYKMTRHDDLLDMASEEVSA